MSFLSDSFTGSSPTESGGIISEESYCPIQVVLFFAETIPENDVPQGIKNAALNTQVKLPAHALFSRKCNFRLKF